MPETGHGPRAASTRSDNIAFGDQEAEPDAGQPVGLAERSQDDQPRLRHSRNRAQMRLAEFGEGLVDDQPAAASLAALLKRLDLPAVHRAAIRIIGIAQDGDIAGFQDFRGRAFQNLRAGGRPDGGMLAIGRR